MEADLTEQQKKNVIDKRASCQKDSLLQKRKKDSGGVGEKRKLGEALSYSINMRLRGKVC